MTRLRTEPKSACRFAMKTQPKTCPHLDSIFICRPSDHLRSRRYLASISVALATVRNAIATDKTGWQKVKKSKLPILGDSLTRPPRGFDPEHPFIEDIKHKDFTNIIYFNNEQVSSDGFMNNFVKACKSMSPLMEFLCHSLGLSWN